MKIKMMLMVAVLAFFSVGLHAQTNTNSFVITPSAAVTIQPAITVTSLTVSRILIDSQNQRMTIWFVGVTKPVTIQGAAFAAFKTQFQGTFAAAIAAYIQANPPMQ